MGLSVGDALLVLDARKEKLDKLDNAFLFIISVLGLLVTIIQTFLSGIQGLIEAFPLLVLGIPIPFYIGYIRGTISISQIEKQIVERIRGWAYLLVGIGGYFSLIWENPLFYFAVLLIALFSIHYILKWFVNVFEVGDNLSYRYSVYGSGISAFLLAFLTRLTVKTYVNPTSFLTFSVYTSTAIWIITAVTSAVLIFEKASRMVMNTQLGLTDIQIERRKKGNFVDHFTAGIWDLAGMIIGTNKRATIIWLLGLFVNLVSFFVQGIITRSFPDESWSIVPIATIFNLASMSLIIVGTILFLKISKLNVTFLQSS